MAEIQDGKHLGAVRKWIKWKFPNGDRVTWGSDQVLGKVTVSQLEELSQTVADALEVDDLHARVHELEKQMNAEYWDKVRDENIELKALAVSLKADLKKAEKNFQGYRETMKLALGWK